METQKHKQWLTNEYDQWQKALNESTIDNFKQHPAVIRMIGLEDDHQQFAPLIQNLEIPWKDIETIDRIGKPPVCIVINSCKISGVCLRYIYYADKILKKLSEIDARIVLEIGGGYAGLFSVLSLIKNYRRIKIDNYTISDLPESNAFHFKYLKETVGDSIIRGFNSTVINHIKENKTNFQYIISFYALGEFDNKTKEDYIHNVISKIPHGFIVWNAHSGADDTGIELIKKYHPTLVVQPENPLTSPGNIQLTW